jgi:hypothetical protein
VCYCHSVTDNYDAIFFVAIVIKIPSKYDDSNIIFLSVNLIVNKRVRVLIFLFWDSWSSYLQHISTTFDRKVVAIVSNWPTMCAIVSNWQTMCAIVIQWQTIMMLRLKLNDRLVDIASEGFLRQVIIFHEQKNSVQAFGFQFSYFLCCYCHKNSIKIWR